MQRKLFFSVLFSTLYFLSFSQIPIWQTHSNFDFTLEIQVKGNEVWAATYGGIVVRDTSGNPLNKYSMNDFFPGRFSHIEIDVLGNVWANNSNSELYKFDGTIWTNYNSTNSLLGTTSINCFDSDSSGAIWCGATNKIFKFNDSTITYFNNPGENYVSVIADGTKIWAGGNFTLYYYNGSVWQGYTNSNTGFNMGGIRDMKKDSFGKKWFVSGTYGLISFNDTTWVNHTDPALNPNAPIGGFRSIYIDNNDLIWLATEDSGIYSYDRTNWVRYYPPSYYMQNNHVTSFTADSSGNIWIAELNGITKFNRSNTWNNYNSQNEGLVSNDIHSIVIDSMNNKWIATEKGLSKFSDSTWTTYNSYNTTLPDPNISDIELDQNNHLWFASQKGLVEYDGTTWTNHTSNLTGSSIIGISDICIDQFNNKWLGTFYSGDVKIIKYDGISSTIITGANSPLNGAAVGFLKMDNSGNLIIGTVFNGVFKYDGTNWTNLSTLPNSPSVNMWIKCCAVNQNGHIWFGTYNDGIFIFDGINWTRLTTSNSGLSSNMINKIDFDKRGNAYISSGWLQRFDGNTWETILAYNKWSILSSAHCFDENDNMFIANKAAPNLLVYRRDSLESKKIIKGRIYHDENLNGIKDPLEDYISGILVKQYPNNINSFTNSTGQFTFFNDTLSSFTLEIPQQGYWYAPQSPIFNGTTINDSLLPEIGLIKHDTAFYTGSLANYTSRCNSQVPLWFSFKNAGSKEDSISILISVDTSLNILSSIPSYDSIISNNLYYHFDNLQVNTPELITLSVLMPDFSHIGDTIHSIGTINSKLENTMFQFEHNRIITCSYDPNLKEVEPIGFTNASYTLKSEKLHYTIHFQNTGNDTAHNVSVWDYLDNYLDLSTFEVKGSSHPFSLEFVPPRQYKFHFNNIMLPDSNINEPLSHGFISFDIYCLPNTPEQTIINNTANIFFDSNPAITTNTTVSNMVSSFPTMTFIKTLNNGSLNVKIAPQPFSNKAVLNFPNEAKSIVQLQIFDLMGKTIFIDQTNGDSFNLSKEKIGASGLYFYKLNYQNRQILSGKVLVD